MSKRIKTILWSAVALVVLIALALTLVLTAPSEEESSVPVVESITLIDENYADTESIYIKNPYDEYTIELVGEEMWRIRDTMDLEQLTYIFDQTVSDVASFGASEIIEEDCQDLSRFGLDEPNIVFEVKYANGNSYRFNIGTMSADRAYYYLCEEGDNTVYMTATSSVSCFALTRYSYLNAQVLESFDLDDVDNFPQISRIKVWNASNDVTVVLDEAKEGELGETPIAQQSHLVMREPCFALISVDKAETPIFGTFGLVATDIVKANITAEDRTYYGFDSPSALFEMDYNDTSVKLEIGAGFNSTDGYTPGAAVAANKIDSYFLIREGTDQIYVVSADDLPWLHLETKDLISASVVVPNIVDISGFDVTIEGEKYEIVFDPGEDVTDSSDYTATLNGKEVDMDSVRKFMQLIMMTSAQDVTAATPTGDPTLTISYNYHSGSSSVVKVYVAEDTTTYLTLDEKTVYVGRYGYVGKVINEMQDLISGGVVDTEW